MDTPKLDARIVELQAQLDQAIRDHDRVSKELFRAVLSEMLVTRERLKAKKA